jgi:PAS domain S-box-containing protein
MAGKQACTSIPGFPSERLTGRLPKGYKGRMDARRELLDSLPLAVAIHVNGVCAYVNPSAVALFGVAEASEVEGRPLLEFVHPESRAVVIERMKAVMVSSAPLPPLEERLLRADGEAVTTEVTALPIDFEGQRAGLVLIRDVSDTRRALEAERLTAERLGVLHETVVGLLGARTTRQIADAALARLDRLVPCDLSAVVTLDVEHDQCEAIALHTALTSFPEANPRFPLEDYGGLEDFLRGQDYYEPDTQRSKGSAALGTLLGTVGVRSYLTVPLLARGALLGGLTVGSVEPGAFSREHMELVRQVATPLAVAIEQDQLRSDLEQHAATLEASVTERTTELRELVSELEAFTYSVSHDLRAPLRAMQGFADALVEDFAEALGPVGVDYAERLRAASGRMSRLIDDLLAYSRLRRGELKVEPVSILDCVHEAMLQIEPTLVARHASVEVAPDLPAVLGHPVVLTQVLGNLLANATKFVPPERAPEIRITCELTNQTVRVCIDDNGIGIEPRFHQRIFRVFERLHGGEAYGHGSGVGLAVVKRGIERLGGRVGVQSEPGRGSRFWLELPLAVTSP